MLCLRCQHWQFLWILEIQRNCRFWFGWTLLSSLDPIQWLGVESPACTKEYRELPVVLGVYKVLTADGSLRVDAVGVSVTAGSGARRLQGHGSLDPGDSRAALVGGAGLQPGGGEQRKGARAWGVVYSFCHS